MKQEYAVKSDKETMVLGIGILALFGLIVYPILKPLGDTGTAVSSVANDVASLTKPVSNLAGSIANRVNEIIDDPFALKSQEFYDLKKTINDQLFFGHNVTNLPDYTSPIYNPKPPQINPENNPDLFPLKWFDPNYNGQYYNYFMTGEF